MAIGHEAANVASLQTRRSTLCRERVNVGYAVDLNAKREINSALIDQDEIHFGMGDTARFDKVFYRSSAVYYTANGLMPSLIGFQKIVKTLMKPDQNGNTFLPKRFGHSPK